MLNYIYDILLNILLFSWFKKTASVWFESIDADVLFYGRHNNPHTFFLGYLLRSSRYISGASIIQVDELNYSPQVYPPRLDLKIDLKTRFQV